MGENSKHHYHDIESISMHWIEMGSTSKRPPIIFVHGLSDCHLSWKYIASDFAKDRRVLIPDLPGHGLSGRPDASYTLEWHATILKHWLEQLGIEEADFIGHSYGGGVAQMLLRVDRKKVRHLVLLSSGGLGKEVAFELRLASIPWVVEKFGQPFMAFGTILALGHLHKISLKHATRLARINAKKGTARAFARTVRDVINWKGQYRNLFQHLHEVEGMPPIAIFWGERDRIIPAKHAYDVANVVDGITLETFSDCGHYPHHENPSLVAQKIKGFLYNKSSV